MAGIDRFLAFELSNEFKDQLEKNELQKLERRLFMDEGMSIKLAMEHFNKFHKKLKQIQVQNPINFEKKCLQNLCKFKKKDNSFTVKILNNELIQKVIENFGDQETRLLLQSVMSEAHTTPEILKISNVPKTSAYRKIENLILNGIIVEDSKIKSESKKISKYVCVFEQLSILFNNSISVDARLAKDHVQKSTILKKLVIE